MTDSVIIRPMFETLASMRLKSPAAIDVLTLHIEATFSLTALGVLPKVYHGNVFKYALIE
jgi:hypothetical protein